MKLRILIFICIPSSLISMDRPPLILSLEEHSSGDVASKSLQDFIELQERAGKLCKIVPKTISHEFDVKILRVHSEGEVDKLDCESINNLIRIECSQAAGVIASLDVSRSIMSSMFAEERYDKARERYRNALHHIQVAFGLKCYKTMDKLYQVLAAFVEAEQKALRENNKRKLDPQTQTLFEPLDKIIRKEEDKAQKVLIPIVNTQEIVGRLAVPKSPSNRSPKKIGGLANRSLENGNTHLKAARELLKNLQDPTLESLDNIEITLFIALEHFVTAYHRDVNQGLENAETALKELEHVHNLKKDKFGKEGKRYNLAIKKLNDAKNLDANTSAISAKVLASDEYSDTTEQTASHHSNPSYSLEQFLREDATADKTTPSSEDVSHATTVNKKEKFSAPSPLNSARSEKSKISDSEKAVKEKDDTNAKEEIVLFYLPPRSVSRSTPLSLLKSAWKNCKEAGKGTAKGAKSLWGKLPFN